MPEVLTKYPDAVLAVVKSAGAKCGVGEPQKILTKCPKDKFCSFPGGEMCIYGVPEVAQMTQISAMDLAPSVCAKRDASTMGFDGGIAALGLAFVLGAFVVLRRRSRSTGRTR